MLFATLQWTTTRVVGRSRTGVPVNAAVASKRSLRRNHRHFQHRTSTRSSSHPSATTTTVVVTAAASPRGDDEATATASATATAALGIEYPASAPGEGVRGRGLFADGSDPDVPLIRTPLNITLCVPEAVGPGAPAECADAVRAMYAQWEESLGVAPPAPLVEFVVSGEMPKDLRIAAALMWATRHVPAWRDYGENVMPRSYDSLYLATEDELEALQDENVKRMAAGSRMNYAAGWKAMTEAHPDVVAAIGADATQEEFDWARATAHTRAMAAKVAGAPCAFIVPGVDLANHSFQPNTNYGISADGTFFQLSWDTSGDDRKPGGATPTTPSAKDEVLICYGERMPNALLMLHYGFMDPDNPNETLPMEVMIPGARKIRMGTVVAAGKALEEGGDIRAAWAAQNMMRMADPSEAGDDASDAACISDMIAATETQLAAFPTTIEEDEALLEVTGGMTSRMEMCVRYRLLQKQNIAAFRRFLDKVASSA